MVALPTLSPAVPDAQASGDTSLAPHPPRHKASARARNVGAALAVVVLTTVITWQVAPVFQPSTRPESTVSRAVENGPVQVNDPANPLPASETTIRTFTVTKPTGGTVLGVGGLLCGTQGSTCSVEIPTAAALRLSVVADPNYEFAHWTGDCVTNSSTADSTQGAAKTCGAVFTPSAGTVVADRRAPSRPSGPPVNTSPGRGVEAMPMPPLAMSPGPARSEPLLLVEIRQLVNKYCAAYETLKPEAVRTLFRSAATAPPSENFEAVQVTQMYDDPPGVRRL